MANLAILGHASRGKEVIETLEMLGGINTFKVNLTEKLLLYCLREEDNVIIGTYPNNSITSVFTLEDFLEKFPYKIGDKVNYVKYNDEYPNVYTIQGMRWNGISVEYLLDLVGFSALTKDLQPYKEENMGKRQYEELRMPLDDDDKLATEATIEGNKITPPENYLIGKITKVDNGMIVEFVKKQAKYPKTYKECCDVLGISTMDNDAQGYKAYLIISFQELLIARDAYLKIAGEQMGLDKPWEPDWEDESENKYTIVLHGNKNCYANCKGACSFLTFPTVEMRDTFYENFKDLIEGCKTFL